WRDIRAIHLFIAAPAGFAALLGQLVNGLGPIQTYEHPPRTRSAATAVPPFCTPAPSTDAGLAVRACRSLTRLATTAGLAASRTGRRPHRMTDTRRSTGFGIPATDDRFGQTATIEPRYRFGDEWVAGRELSGAIASP